MVSIHASRCREAMPFSFFFAGTGGLFQSTPPVAGRRCHLGEAMTQTYLEFQSTPPVAGRRCLRGTVWVVACISFNPRLPLPGGDAVEVFVVRVQRPVSIHASRCREAMPEIWGVTHDNAMFQSTPPVAGRRCVPRAPLDGRVWRVSIHASRCREAMHGRRLALPIWAGFNPRLPLPGGDAAWPAPSSTSGAFQSTPPVAGRRCLLSANVPATPESFNPRLPLPGGDAVCETVARANQIIVSIHASRCREAMRAPVLRMPENNFVSIHASRCREAMRLLGHHRGKQGVVSIHASRCREAMLWSLDQGDEDFDVSIHASRCREAMRHQLRNGRGVVGVSIHASRCREAMRPDQHVLRQARGVSIHASRCREAMRRRDADLLAVGAFQSTPPVAGRRCRRSCQCLMTRSSFNPRLPLPGGDALFLATPVAAIGRFNPRLPLPGGDAGAFISRDTNCPSFNPRLPLPGGDAAAAVLIPAAPVVSIHASRCREAMLCSSESQNVRVSFQSTPPVAGRRCGFFCGAGIGGWGFNPRLPLPGGDAREWGAVSPTCKVFQSTPPVAGRRCPVM